MSSITTFYGGKHKVPITVFTDDLHLLGELPKVCFGKYPYIGGRLDHKTIHSLVMGPRPENIPKSWVIDHKDRNTYNSCRDNLRWVSQSFNAWNCQRQRIGTSRFRGVDFVKRIQKWRARVGDEHCGLFDEERDAAIASATAYVRLYGDLAATSDLLVGKTLLTQIEMNHIAQSIANRTDIRRKQETKVSKGVYFESNLYKVMFRGVSLGYFRDQCKAIAHREEYIIADRQKEWMRYKLVTPHTDDDGDVAIKLTVTSGGTKFSKVDPEFWHTLTFRRKWLYTTYGYAAGRVSGLTTPLHKAVINMIIPNYVPIREASIDHIDPSQKLDNRRKNLRIASRTVQSLNQKKRGNDRTSKHVGVSKNANGTWVGKCSYRVDGIKKCFRVMKETEQEVIVCLNQKRIETYGSDAILS
jgi:hypothetical protein